VYAFLEHKITMLGQGDSQGVSFSPKSFNRARLGVAPPLFSTNISLYHGNGAR